MNHLASSIGIIGGADGPTSVFVAAPSEGSIFPIVIVGAAIVLAAMAIIYMIHKQ